MDEEREEDSGGPSASSSSLPRLCSAAQWLSPFLPTTCRRRKPRRETRIWAEAEPAGMKAAFHPFEVVHVGGLNRSADEGQVVDLCGLLVSQARLDEQLEENRSDKRRC